MLALLGVPPLGVYSHSDTVGENGEYSCSVRKYIANGK